MADQLAGEGAVVQVNVEENPALASRIGVRGIPVVMLFNKGKVIDRIEGARSVESVLSWFRQHR